MAEAYLEGRLQGDDPVVGRLQRGPRDRSGSGQREQALEGVLVAGSLPVNMTIVR
jgi:hypothetical protein